MKDGKMTIGYKRVSSTDQNTARQLDGVQVDRIFEDKCSGRDRNRPELRRALDILRSGDRLVVHSMDRLARDMRDLQDLVKELTDRGITVQFVSENLAFTGNDDKYATLLLHVLGGVAQFERAMIRERQAEGIRKARAEGKYRGRSKALNTSQVAEIRNRMTSRVSIMALAKEYGVSRQTIYSAIATDAQ